MKETYISSTTSSTRSSKIAMINSTTSSTTISSVQMNGNVSSSSSSSTTTTNKQNADDNVEYMEVDSNEEKIDLADVPVLMKRPLKMGDYWYIVDKTWFDKLTKFLDTNDAAYHPGQIDNAALLDPVKNNAQKNYSEPMYRLKKDLVEDEHYVVVPEEVYNLIADKFGTVTGIGGHAIKCEVVNNGSPKRPYLIVEIKPLELRLSVYQSKDDLVAQYSRNTTLRKILADMRRLFNIDDNRLVQLWSNANILVSHVDCQQPPEENVAAAAAGSADDNAQVDSTSDSKIPPPPPPPTASTSTANNNNNGKTTYKLGQTLQEIDLADNTTLTIEIQNADETWPSSKLNKYGAITRSKGNAHSVQIVPPGVCGLMNLGNTCFMNAALQCLSNTPALTEFLITDRYLTDINADNPLGMGGQIARVYAELVKVMWSGCHQTVTPREFKSTVGRFAPQFSGFAQHDCQELMAFLLDGLHEDLNRVRVKPYIEMNNDLERRPDVIVAAESWNNYKRRNDSIIVDTFHSQLKSTLVCPECTLVSVTFDPFCYLTLPLPYYRERSVNITFVPAFGKRPMHANSRAHRYNVSTSTDVSNSNLSPVRSILMENIMIPKVGCISDIANVVAKVLNDSYASAFNHQIDANRLHVFNVNGNECKKLFAPSDTYTSFFEDIVVYEEDELTPTIITTTRAQAKTSASSKGNCVIVYLRYKDDTSISRPFMVKVSKLSYEEIREAILRELATLVPPNEVDSFIEALEKTYEEPKSPSQMEISSSSLAKSSKASKRRGMQNGSDGEEEEEADEEDDNQVNTTTGEEGEEEIEEEEEDTCEARAASREKAYEIAVVNRQGTDSFSTLCPGSSITADSGVDPAEGNAFVSFNISSTLAHKFFPRNINNYGQVKLSNLLAGSGFGRAQKTSLTLDECINQFTTVEKLGADDPWYCPRCKKHQMADKKFDIWLLPNILIIHLKRFSYSRTHRDKLDVLVDFPVENLDMTSYVQHNPNNESYRYDLIAVANHYGGLGGGHYTAYAKNFKNQKWYYFDDSNVSAVNDGQVVGKPAYVLFYQRQPNTTANGSGGNTGD